jgi:hypothetical protein
MRVYIGEDGQGWGGESANGLRGRTPKRDNKDSLSAAGAATGLQARYLDLGDGCSGGHVVADLQVDLCGVYGDTCED